jgi:hypothetical protein
MLGESSQEVMPLSAGGFRSQSLLRKGQFRLRRVNKKTRKSIVERFALLTREEREKLEEHQTDFVRPVPAVPG